MSVGYVKNLLLGGMVCAAEVDTLALKLMQWGFTLEHGIEQLTHAFQKYSEAVDSAVAEVEQQVMDQADAREASGGRSS